MSIVMVVEDEALILANIVQILQMVGLTVLEAANGEAAWELLMKHPEQPPQLVLTDLMMPKLDGFGLVARIKSHASFATIPCVILSARSAPADIQHAYSLGVSDYLVKPFEIEQLLATLARHMDGQAEQLHGLSAAFRLA
jgi:DNA-binding response OmpR family regulator